MAPSNEETHLVKGVMNYMGQIAEQTSSRCHKKIAASSELKAFLMYLSERAPLAMNELLRLASRKCEDTLRGERDAWATRKRAEPPNGNETNAKRVKITRPTKDETALSQQVAEADSMAQGHADVLQPRDNTVHACDNRTVIKDESEQESFGWTSMMNDTLIVSDSDEDDDTSGQIVPKSSHRDDMVKLTRSVSSDTEDEVSTPRSDSQCSEIAPPQTSASENDAESGTESSEEEDPDTEPTENELSSVATTPVRGPKESETVLLPTPYEVEYGLPMMKPDIEAYVRAHCVTLRPLTTRLHFDIHGEISQVLNASRLLEFYKTRRELYQYLENRVIMPGRKLQAQITWNISNPSEILDALQTVKKNTFDAKIHRAYGQTMLFSSVNTEVARGYKSTVTGRLADHTAILEQLARNKAGAVSQLEKEQMISSYLREYYAGKKWLGVIDWFGGSGIVLVFVTAGIGSHYVEYGWTEFQRDCFQYVAGLLHSIRGLVETLGSHALELYCRNGCLDNDCIDRVKRAEFTQADGGEGSEDDSD